MYTDIDEEKNHEARLRVVYRQKGKRYKEILLKDVLAPPLLKTAQAGWLAFSWCDLTMGLFFSKQATSTNNLLGRVTGR